MTSATGNRFGLKATGRNPSRVSSCWLKPQDGLALVRLDALAMDLPVLVRESCEPGDGLVVKVREVDSFADLLRLTGQRGSGPHGLGPG